MDYEIDLDPVHSVIRVTVTAEALTLSLMRKIFRNLSEVMAGGGPYAVIFDGSTVKLTESQRAGDPPIDLIRSVLPHRPLTPVGRKHVIVGKEPHVSKFASIFHMCTESIGEPAGFILTLVYDTGEIDEFQVVYSLEESYDIVGARPEDFTVCFLPFGQVTEST